MGIKRFLERVKSLSVSVNSMTDTVRFTIIGPPERDSPNATETNCGWEWSGEGEPFFEAAARRELVGEEE